MDVQKMTREYHAKYHPTHGRMTPSTVTRELLDSRRAMWDEEVAEVAEAWDTFEFEDEDAVWVDERREESPVELLAHLMHELADVVYVAYGTAERCGVDLDDVINAVHRANMRKVPSTTGGKATKPPGWESADAVVAELVRRADRSTDPFTQPAPVRQSAVRDDRTPGPVFTCRFSSDCGNCGGMLEEGDEARMVDGSACCLACFP